MAAESTLDARIAGSFRDRYRQELLRNSGQFPIANLLLELLLEGPRIFLGPDAYVLVAAALAQAWLLTAYERSRPVSRLIGNLSGPAAYTAVEFLFEGPKFFSAPNHVAYWCFGAAIGLLQWARRHAPRGATGGALLVAESVARAAILFAMYAIFESLTSAKAYSVGTFFADRSHVFIALATLFLGLYAGLESLAAQGYLGLLRETSTQLKRYSEWLLGPELLERVVKDPSALSLARRERSVLFMDVRGFTGWSEHCAPETVVRALNEYYAAAEPVLRAHGAIKMKFTADEVLAVFGEPRQAAACGLALRGAALAALAAYGLKAGIGLHAGPVVEGLLGSEGLKGYDVIGDTVNTAKRIEGSAAGGEVLVSAALLAALGAAAATGPRRDVAAKGKEAPLEVYPLLGLEGRCQRLGLL
jgi:class 3 adenylate cyclase